MGQAILRIVQFPRELDGAGAGSADAAYAMDPDAHERALAARIAAGEVPAYAALLELYWEPLVRYAARTLASSDAAEDAVQQAFIRLWENRAKLKPTQSPRAYLYRLVHNLSIDELRRRGIRERFARTSVEPAGPPTPADCVEGDELGAAARDAIEALPERRRDVFVLAHFHDLSYQQIAETLDIAPRTVANHMTLALRDLREALQPFVDRKLGPR
jgi:RNA polymerase sigma-70 factor, ECF subfamily